jgi:hypothetical protein
VEVKGIRPERSSPCGVCGGLLKAGDTGKKEKVGGGGVHWPGTTWGKERGGLVWYDAKEEKG